MTRLAIGVSLLVLFIGLALADSHGQDDERFAAATGIPDAFRLLHAHQSRRTEAERKLHDYVEESSDT
jgi:hypothetical protein